MSPKNPLENLLNLALSMSEHHYEYYDMTAKSVETPQVQALLRVLADTERDLIIEIQDMIVTGVLDEIEEMGKVEVGDDPPDVTPFAPERNDSDPRIFVCNKSLEQEVKGYTFYLSIAARAKSELVSRVFEYLAFIKSEQIERIRKVCETF
jgi:rubrerythrin